MAEEKNITEILHHMGELDLPFGAVAPPLFQTSIFRFDNFLALLYLCHWHKFLP